VLHPNPRSHEMREPAFGIGKCEQFITANAALCLLPNKEGVVFKKRLRKGNPMNDLITILIILAAIISFLNKLFGERKKAESERSDQSEKPPFEWKLPWEMEEDEPQKEIFGRPWMDLDAAPSRKQEPFASATMTEAVPTAPTDKIASSQSFESKPIETVEPSSDGLSLDLSSETRLQEGIVLAEVLGPCRAKRRFF